jgi:hypothetical protein
MTQSDSPTPEIHSDSEYRETSIALGQRRHPPKVLRRLMNAFESYRQARKYGWSRPWNKYDLLNFQSFRLNPAEDRWLVEKAGELISERQEQIPEPARAFVRALLADAKLMGFVFVHDYTEGDLVHEGATLSFGRVNDKRYRDRFDIVLESPLRDGMSGGLNRCRLFIDPYRSDDKKPLFQEIFSPLDSAVCGDLFAAMSRISFAWSRSEARIWDHWTSAYIDYFGDRVQRPTTSFFLAATPSTRRLGLDVPEGFEISTPEAVKGAA